MPPNYDVWKYYLDVLNKIIESSTKSSYFLDVDEEVYSRLAQAVWNHGNLYKKSSLLLVAFTIFVPQKDVL